MLAHQLRVAWWMSEGSCWRGCFCWLSSLSLMQTILYIKVN